MIFTTDAEVSRRVFTYNDPETLLMAVHPSGKNILGEGNLAFMHGPPHKAIRKSFLSLFTRKALATYVELQDGIIREHLKQWQQVKGEREIRLFVRSVITVLHFCYVVKVRLSTWQGGTTASALSATMCSMSCPKELQQMQLQAWSACSLACASAHMPLLRGLFVIFSHLAALTQSEQDFLLPPGISMLQPPGLFLLGHTSRARKK